MEKKFKSGFITIVGRPNVGKSTLMNRLIGQKISIISNKPQTTRNTIQTVLTTDDYQIVFLDTPGIHKPRHALGEYMVKAAQGTLNEVDIVLFMTTPEGEAGGGDKYIIENLKDVNTPVILIINKVDAYNKADVAKTIASYNELLNFSEIVPISALSGDNVDDLLNTVIDKLPEGPKYFPEDAVTDQPERFIISELIREKALNFLEQEVPHGIAVEVIQMKEDEEDGKVHIDATIYCEKNSHKGIIIGREGQMLKRIRLAAKRDIERLLGSKVSLEIWVKVKKDWRDNPNALRGFGYK